MGPVEAAPSFVKGGQRCSASRIGAHWHVPTLHNVPTGMYTHVMSTTPITSRQRLIDAMAELLWERGYAATSPRDVMSAANVGQGSFYHHFSGKHELAVAALRQNIAEAAGTSACVKEESPLDELKAHLLLPRIGQKGCRVGRMTQDPQVLQDSELLGLVEEAFEAAEGRWRRLIDAAMALGELPETLDSEQLASTLAAVLQGGYVLARARGSQKPMDDALHGMASLLDSLSQTDEARRNVAMDPSPV